MKMIKLLLVVGVLAWVTVLGYGAYRVYLSFDISDPLRLSRIGLKAAELERLTEQERQKTERERRETAKTLAKLRRQELVESSKAVKLSAVVLAVFVRSFPALAFLTAIFGGFVYVLTKKVPVKTPFVETVLPVKRAAAIAERSLQVSNAAEMARVMAFSEDISRGRLSDSVNLFKALRPGRENISINQSALPAATDDHPAHAVPTFSDLFHAGKFAPGKPLVFGFQESGQPKTGTWSHAYSLGIAGMSGSGKSSTIRFIMSESLLTGAVGRFYVIDPHYPHPESLLASLGDLIHAPQVVYAENPIDTAAMIDEIHARIDARIATQEPSTPLLVVVVDELPVVVKKFPRIAELIERIGMESRKAGVYGIFSAQSWNGDKTGGTTARDNLTALLVHKMKRKQAHTLLQDAELTRQVLRLQPGQVLFSPTKGDPELLTVPFCAVEDMPDVVHVLSKGAKFGAGASPVTPENEIGGEMNTETNEPENDSEGKIDNVIPFPKREPSNQFRTNGEPDTFDVKKLRESAGLSQGKFAELTGCSLSKLKKVETNSARFDADEISMILTNLDAWQEGVEPTNQLRTKSEPGANDTRTIDEPTHTREA